MSGDHSCGVSAGKRALRGTGPSLAGNVGTGGAFALAREGDYRVSTFLRSLRPGPAPLGVFGGALRGTGPSLAGNVGTGGAFALAREGDYRVSTFLRSLRPGPAPLGVFGALRGTSPALAGGVQRLPRSLPKALGFRMPWGVIIPVINSGGVTSKPGLRAVLVGLAIRT